MFGLLICDDHPPIRTALRLMARTAAGQCDVTETGSASELLAALRSRTVFDLLILDLHLPTGSGLDLVEQVHGLRPELAIMVLSADDSEHSRGRAAALGIATYLSKSASERELFDALRAAVSNASDTQGSRTEPPHETDTGPLAAARRVALDNLRISPRQSDVLQCLMRGMSEKEIARTLNISLGTVKSHTVAVFRALNVNSRAKAVVEAHSRGIPLET